MKSLLNFTSVHFSDTLGLIEMMQFSIIRSAVSNLVLITGWVDSILACVKFSELLPLFFSCGPVQLLKTTDLSRHNLLYLKEIGNGWFGKVGADRLLLPFRTALSQPGLDCLAPAWCWTLFCALHCRQNHICHVFLHPDNTFFHSLPFIFCLLLLSQCSLLNKHPPSPSVYISPRSVHLYVCLHFVLHGFCFTFPSPSANISVISLDRNMSFSAVIDMRNVSGSAGGGEHGPKHHSGGGEGAQVQRQRAGPDALPGGSSAVPVHVSFGYIWVWSHFRLSDGKRTRCDLRSWTCGTKSL